MYLGNDAKDPVYEKCPGFVEPVTREEFDRLVAHVDTFTDAFGHVKAALDGLTRGGLRTSARSALNRLRRIADAVIFEARR